MFNDNVLSVEDSAENVEHIGSIIGIITKLMVLSFFYENALASHVADSPKFYEHEHSIIHYFAACRCVQHRVPARMHASAARVRAQAQTCEAARARRAVPASRACQPSPPVRAGQNKSGRCPGDHDTGEAQSSRARPRAPGGAGAPGANFTRGRWDGALISAP